MDYLVPLIILLLCLLGMASGYIFTKKPFEKRCGLEPAKHCTCDDKENPCDKKDEHAKMLNTKV